MRNTYNVRYRGRCHRQTVQAETYPASNASYLCFSPDETKLYAVGESQKYNSEFGGSVHSFDVSPQGGLTETSAQPTRGSYPCHLTLVGNLLIASNYGSGSVSRFPLNEDGTITTDPIITAVAEQ